MGWSYEQNKSDHRSLFSDNFNKVRYVGVTVLMADTEMRNSGTRIQISKRKREEKTINWEEEQSNIQAKYWRRNNQASIVTWLNGNYYNKRSKM